MVRADRLEQIVHAAFRASRAARQTKGRFEADERLLALAGGDAARLAAILRAAGFHVSRKDGALTVQPKRRRGPAQDRPPKAGSGKARKSGDGGQPRTRSDSPFAKLREWQAAE